MAENADSLLALLRRTTDPGGYLEPHLGDPNSAAIMKARIAVFARLGPAVDHNAAQGLISDASGGTAGTCTLTVSRTSGTTTGTIPKGYPFVDARGVRAILQTDVVVTAAQLSKNLPLETLRRTELVNTPEAAVFVVAPDAPVIPGSAGVLIAPAGTAGMTADTFQTIGPSTPIAGAATDFLSIHGSERSLPRQANETTSDYRQRIRNIPDAVSPIVIGDSVQAAAQRAGLPAMLVLEPFRDLATTALKDLHGLSHFDPGHVDEYLDDPLGGVLVDRRLATAYFAIQVQDYLRDPTGAVMYLDDAFLDDPILGYPDIEGIAPQVIAGLLAVMSDVSVKKAAGVNFDLLLKPPDTEVSQGTRSANTFGAVANFTPDPGTVWAIVEGVASHDGPDPTVLVEHMMEFDLEGGGLYTTPIFGDSWSQRIVPPTERVTAIRGYLRSDGVMTAKLVVALKVIAIVL